MAWSVIVAFSRASYVPWDQVSPSGPLIVFYCRVAVLYVSSSRCRGLVCDVTFSCASHVPWDQVSHSGLLGVFSCRLAVGVILLRHKAGQDERGEILLENSLSDDDATREK